jgi:hypothetical protein
MICFENFKARQHPIVLVEESALRWMGLRVSPIEVSTSASWRLKSQDLDLHARDSEIEAIKTDLLAIGQYELVEQNPSGL